MSRYGLPLCPAYVKVGPAYVEVGLVYVKVGPAYVEVGLAYVKVGPATACTHLLTPISTSFVFSPVICVAVS